MCSMALSHIALFLSLLATNIQAGSPSDIQWSSTTHGPDGPWYAVTVKVGRKVQVPVDLFPGHHGPSNILGIDYCRRMERGSACTRNALGTWDPSATGGNNSLYTLAGPSNWMRPLATRPVGGMIVDSQEVPVKNGNSLTAQVGINIVVDGTYTLGTPSDNQSFEYTLGTLSLGSDRSGIFYANTEDIAANFTPNCFYLDGEIPSASFGLHVGSVTPNIAPSLVYGGYDQAHVLAPVITQNYNAIGHAQLQLKDISLGTSVGAMPQSLQNRNLTGLLVINGTNGLLSPTRQVITVNINPGLPYLVLPTAACQAITQGLPMTYDERFQLWLWNTGDPEYQRLVNGANYLAFTFAQPENPDVTIKIPFQLLNVTLSAPLSTMKLQYFPCFASPDDRFALGRAFLQGAFYGGNWIPQIPNSSVVGTWFLAQAPGPGLGPSNITAIAADDRSIDASNMTWESTWSDTWQPLQSPESMPTTPSTPSTPTGLSSAAQAGIGVGCGIVGLAIPAVIAFWLWSRRRKKSDPDTDKGPELAASPMYRRELPGYVDCDRPVEAPERPETRHELGATEGQRPRSGVEAD